MVSVRGVFRRGAAQPDEEIEGREGQPVLITFLREPGFPSDGDDTLERLLDQNAVETGISDLASEHDHYVHGRPKGDL